MLTSRPPAPAGAGCLAGRRVGGGPAGSGRGGQHLEPAALGEWTDQRPEEFAEHKAWWADTGEPVRPGEWGAVRAIGGEFSADEEVTIEAADGEQKTIRNSATPICGCQAARSSARSTSART